MAETKPFVVDEALRWRVFRQVGDIVKPTNPLIPLIPQLKSYDEWVEFTKTDLYKKLMDHENPLHKPSMHPSLYKKYEKMQKKRKELIAAEGYPSYMRTKTDRFAYRLLWASTIVMGSYSLYRLANIVIEN